MVARLDVGGHECFMHNIIVESKRDTVMMFDQRFEYQVLLIDQHQGDLV